MLCLQSKVEFFNSSCTLLWGSVNHRYTRKVAVLSMSCPTCPNTSWAHTVLRRGRLTPALFPELGCPAKISTVKPFPTAWVRNRASLLGGGSDFLCIHPDAVFRASASCMRYFSVWDLHQVVVILNLFPGFGVRV